MLLMNAVDSELGSSTLADTGHRKSQYLLLSLSLSENVLLHRTYLRISQRSHDWLVVKLPQVFANELRQWQLITLTGSPEQSQDLCAPDARPRGHRLNGICEQGISGDWNPIKLRSQCSKSQVGQNWPPNLRRLIKVNRWWECGRYESQSHSWQHDCQSQARRVCTHGGPFFLIQL